MSHPSGIDALIAEDLQLASLPEVVIRAVDMVNDPDTSASDIGAVINEDPALAARLLKLVNSPFFGFPSRIETVSRAITIVGTLELLDLIMGAVVVKAFGSMPSTLVSMNAFWSHSLYAALVARALAGRHRAPKAERFFIAGLLHDIGSLVLLQRRPRQMRAALERAARHREPTFVAEQAVLGFDHCAVGAALLEAWRLPEALVETARCHHAPAGARHHRLESAIVHCADVIAGAATACAADSGAVPPLEPAAWELTGLDVAVVEGVLAEADSQFLAARAALLGEPAPA
ncbi:MAG TPA: HDOD domain-containing protein [Gammaproteobacteria bacterium]|nr:HDOD domain-containing protein [Gammaproteobacteria bacterium]